MSIDLKFDPKELNSDDLVGIAHCFAEAYDLPFTRQSEIRVETSGIKSIQKNNQYIIGYTSRDSAVSASITVKIYGDCISVNGYLESTKDPHKKQKKDFEAKVKDYFANRPTQVE